MDIGGITAFLALVVALFAIRARRRARKCSRELIDQQFGQRSSDASVLGRNCPVGAIPLWWHVLQSPVRVLIAFGYLLCIAGGAIAGLFVGALAGRAFLSIVDPPRPGVGGNPLLLLVPYLVVPLSTWLGGRIAAGGYEMAIGLLFGPEPAKRDRG